MIRPRLKTIAATLVEAAGHLLEDAVTVGLLFSTAIAIAFGQFLLGCALAALTVGVVLRFNRGRLKRQQEVERHA